MKNLPKQYRPQAVAALMSFRSCEKRALPPAAIIYPLSSTYSDRKFMALLRLTYFTNNYFSPTMAQPELPDVVVLSI